MPPSKTVADYIRAQHPDLVLVTPAVEIGSAQAEYFKAAGALRVPTGLCVASWDNLTNKGVLRVDPDAVFVWNDVQRREAVELHGVPCERVVLTGAPRFDDWFTRRPSRSLPSLSQITGLDPDKPYVLYLCSSPFIAPDEVTFVREWLKALRSSDHEVLASAGVLARPHPQNAAQWRNVDLEEFGNAVIWPREGAQVTDEDAKADFFDSIAHSVAVVGINTTALIEAAILRKSVYTIMAEEFRGTQQGTLHYHYLRVENGGFLHEAASIDESLEQVRPVLEGSVEGREQTRQFVRDFVRPLGLDVPATPALADAIEELARSTPRSPKRSLTAQTLHAPLSLVAASARWRSRRSRLRGRTRLPEMMARIEPARRAARWLISKLEGTDRATEAPPELGADPLSTFHRLASHLLTPSSGEVAIGPWSGDAATEALYWIPCIRWLVGRHGFPPDQLVVVSRTGIPAWYQGLARAVVEATTELDGASCPVRGMVETMLSRGTPLRTVVKRSLYTRLPAPRDPRAADRPPGYVVVAVEPNANDELSARNDESAPSDLEIRSPSLVVRRSPGPRQEWTLESTATGREFETVDTAGLSAVVAGASGVIGSVGSTPVTLAVCHGVRTIAFSASPSEAEWQRVELLARVARSLHVSFTLLDPRQLEIVRAATAATLPVESRQRLVAYPDGHSTP